MFMLAQLGQMGPCRCEDRTDQACKESCKAKAERLNSVSRRATNSCSPSSWCDVTVAG